MMIRNHNSTTAILCLFAAVALPLAAPAGPTADTTELKAAKREYEQSAAPDSEAARARYVNKLAKMLDRMMADHMVNGAQKDDDQANAIHAELKRHPLPKNSDSRALAKLRVGKWQSPRHEYRCRRNGTWFMLPIEEGSPRGLWRIEGDQYIETNQKKESRYYIILLNADYFIFADEGAVFFEWRTPKRNGK